ncbi:MAG: D-alanine--poly(phosphoribitol) ligase subunit 1 [Verrucomicrobiae bacterium]|nr:D-alanine--poly(phosphoribitol) ligase subunit 1 [Verrucomicrobiae bacterium]
MSATSIGDVAIIGMAGRFPGARDINAFWQNLKNGVESIRFFTDAELLAAGVSPELIANPLYVKARPVLADIEQFDPEFFGITPREAALMDPQHRLFLEAATHALDDAGYDPDRYDGAIGVYGGSYLDTYLLANLCHDREYIESVLTGQATGAYHVVLGNDKDYLTTRVAHKLNLRGPAITVQTSCSTSLVAICQACQSLIDQQCDMALAGGVTVIVPQDRGYLAQEGGMFSTDGHCRPFDAQAQGTVFGSGVGVVLLKRLPEALAAGDHIYAVIKGTALNNDGAGKVSYTAPSVTGQAEVVALAQALAGVSAETISYIEAHGTGTPLGDPIEIEALTQAFRQTTDRTGFCGIGSLKGNFGHLDAAAGVAGLIKTALALQHKLLPATLHFTTPNPKINFAGSPFTVIAKATEWTATPRRAGVSSFGVGGTNAHAVLEEAPAREPVTPSRPIQLLTLSAKTPAALEQASANLAAHLKEHSDLDLADVAFTLQVGRRAFPHRRVLVARDAGDAVAILEQTNSKRSFTGQATRRDARVAFLFPGQGAQQLNMGAELYAREPVFREAFDRCARLVPELDLRNATAEQLRQTRFTQPALFAIEYALAELWMSWGIRPAAMIGHSVGEYVAACLAGVFSLEDAMRIVAERARLVQAQPPGAMTAVRLPENDVVPLLGADLSIAAVNAPGLCIVSGPFAAIEAFESKLKSAGTATVRLQTSHAFHSAMMEPVVAPLTALLRQVHLQAPQIPYVSNVTGQWSTGTDADYWAGHVRQPVRFAQGITNLLADPALVLLEVGPGQTLSALARQHPARHSEQVVLSSLGQPDEQSAMLTALGRLWVAGAPLDSAALFAGERRRRVSLPGHPFQRQRCWVEAPGRAAPTTVAPVMAATNAGTPTGTRLRELLQTVTGRDYAAATDQTTFVELGFESLALTQVTLAIAKEFGVRVSFRQLLGDLATIGDLAAHLDEHHAESTPATAPVSPQSSAPLTEAQREVWLAAAVGSATSCVFNQSAQLRLRGPLQVVHMEAALQDLVDRHEGLRMQFAPLGERQTVLPTLVISPAFADLSARTPAEREQQLADWLQAEASTPFDLEHGPLLRARLVKLGTVEHVLLLTVQHIVCDGRSLALLWHELGELYTARCRGRASQLPVAGSLLAYAVTEARLTQSPEYGDAEKFWIEQFADTPPPLDLPADLPRPAKKSYRAGLRGMVLPPELSRQLKQISQRQGGTLFTLLLAAYYHWLQRLSGLDDLVVGVPTATPGAEEFSGLVGHTVNFLAVRAQLDSRLQWPDYCRAVQESFLDAYEHRLFTYASLLQRLRVDREAGRLPLVATSFNLAQARQARHFHDLTVTLEENPFSFANLDLVVDVTDTGTQLEVDCRYDADAFTAATVDRWLGYFQTLLEAIAGNPTGPVGDLSFLPSPERRQALVEWNPPATPIPPVCLHELVEAQTRQTPSRVAVTFGAQSLTYAALNERADAVAAQLRQLGVGHETVVAIYVERSLEMIVGLLGILKASGAYLPLDPAFPADRLAFMIADAQPLAIVTQQKLVNALPAHDAPVLCLDALPAAPTAKPGTAKPADLAYILYTSGSTGKPKGVQIPHSAVVNFLTSMRREPGLTPDDVLVAVTTLSFDIAGLEIFLPLTTGARVVIANRETAADGAALAELLRASGATMLQATPVTWRLLLTAGWRGDSRLKMLCGGEALPAELAAQLLPCGAELWNLYGPTETTIWSAATRVMPGEPIRLGRPLANTTLYIVDRHGQLVPTGVPGELLIGGAGLARGYLKRPELTAEKFIANPFGPDRLYRTGDLVRRHAGGSMEFLGRLDQQVKIRGYRIELGEIEASLARHPGVRVAVVVARADSSGDQRLVAYLTTTDAAPPAIELRDFLTASLPDYMVPTAFVFLKEFPLTPNGKINRKALPAPDQSAAARAMEYVAPRTPTEERLAGIWQEVLRVPQVGTTDNFFLLGGHSLLAVQIVSRVRDSLGVPLSLADFFQNLTVASLAAQVDKLQASTGKTLVEGEVD